MSKKDSNGGSAEAAAEQEVRTLYESVSGFSYSDSLVPRVLQRILRDMYRTRSYRYTAGTAAVR